MILSFTIPGAPPSPNRRAATTRGRMASVKAQREKAYLCAVTARNTMPGDFEGFACPARITFTVYRHRLLDPSINLPASLKATQDGICRALLPLGDGPESPYLWEFRQVKIRSKSDERVDVRIEKALRQIAPRLLAALEIAVEALEKARR